ncbi:auxin efflux carrier [Hanseniaspora valbyensis NRRL Y-1626]|uniref:Auxin efflux carrier n=1 Tax=Hanseniaspora valbyensis NRRL Y-1626 TaxID=766949 RepID=A0A1B7TIC4_9ASCO|nr:auxin efflux carrier [Hanseniaspora valbyensis NRRL Y-1626]
MVQTKLSLGECIYISIKPIIRVYLILATGFLLSKKGLLSPQMTKDVSALVVNALLPCLAFNKIVSYISYKDLQMIGIIVLTSLFIYALGLLGGVGVYFGFKTNPKFFYGLLFCSSCTNISDLTISIMQSEGLSAIFTEDELGKGVSYAVIFMAVQNFMLMNLGLMTVPYYDVKNDNDEQQKKKEQSVESEMEQGTLNNNNDTTTTTVGKSLNDNKEKPESGDITSNDSNEQLEPFDSNNGDNDITSLASSVNSIEVEERANSFQRRRPSIASAIARTFTGHSTATTTGTNRSVENTTDDLVREYSIVSKVRTGDIDLHKPLSIYTDVPTGNAPQAMETEDTTSSNNSSQTSITEDNTANNTKKKDSKPKTKFSFAKWCYSHKLGWLYYILLNFKRPASIATVLGLLCALVPWLRILFVDQSGYHIHQGPDDAPVLSVFMDFTSYVAQASVPLALLLLGGTIAKIDIKTLDFKFLKASIALNLYRLCVMPIIGIAFVNRLVAIGWVETPIQRLSLVITFAVPSATACIYFTALFTPVEGPQVQMACLGSIYVVAYMMFFVTLAVVLTYSIKRDLGY